MSARRSQSEVVTRLRRRSAGSISVDPTTGNLRRGSQSVTLRPKDLAVLLHLVKHRGRLVPKTELVSAGWSGVAVAEGVLKACVNRLRAALGDDVEAPRFIETLPRRGYRFVGSIAVTDGRRRGRLERTPASRIVGREAELEELQRCFARAAAGERQVVFVTGEAGLGKTALVDGFLDTVLPPRVRVARGQCVEHYGAGEVYLPVLEALGRLCRGRTGRAVVAQLARHAPTWIMRMPGLVSPAEHDAMARTTAGATQERMLRELTEALDVVARTSPLVVVLEDLHWSDVSTLDLVATLARRREPARLLVVATYRPEEIPRQGDAVPALVRDLSVRRMATEMALPGLAEAAIEGYLRVRFPGASLAPGLANAVYHRTDGHPLFMVAMAEHWIAHAMLVPVGDRWEARAELDALDHDVPADVRKMINTRYLRLSADERRLVEAASVAGTEFSAASVAAALDVPPPDTDERCDDLARRGMILRRRGDGRWPDGTVAGRYAFGHALYRDVIYEGIPAGRRADLHRRVAEREAAAHGPNAGTIAARLAMHFEQAGDAPGAVQYRLRAARNAVDLGAYREAMTHASAGLEALSRLPAGRARNAQELGLQLVHATAIAMTQGYSAPAADRAYARVLALGREVGDTAESALKGVYLFHLMRGDLANAQDVAEQLLAKATEAGDTAMLLWAHMTLGLCLVHRGATEAARIHLAQGLIHDAGRNGHGELTAHQHDPAVVCHGYLAWCLWTVGHHAQAAEHSRQALRLAETTEHPLTQAQALACASGLHVFRRDTRRVYDQADRAVTLATEHGLTYWRLVGLATRGWARAARGDAAAGVAEMRGALDTLAAIGTHLVRPVHLSMLADALALAGRANEALESLREAAAVAAKNGERFWEPEIHRLTGELHLSRAARVVDASRGRTLAHASAAFRQALAAARAQHARSLELRAAMSLYRLSRHTGDRAHARSALAEIYGGFTEGFDTRDLTEARALLHEG